MSGKKFLFYLDKSSVLVYTVQSRTLKGEVSDCSFCVFLFLYLIFDMVKCSEGDPCQGKQQEGHGFGKSSLVSFRKRKLIVTD